MFACIMFGSRSRLQRLALGPDFRGQVGLQRGLPDGGSAVPLWWASTYNDIQARAWCTWTYANVQVRMWGLMLNIQRTSAGYQGMGHGRDVDGMQKDGAIERTRRTRRGTVPLRYLPWGQEGCKPRRWKSGCDEGAPVTAEQTCNAYVPCCNGMD